MNLTPTELALQSRVEKREIARAKADEIIGMDAPSDTDEQHLVLLREEMAGLDEEITAFLKDKEMDDKARENSKLARQAFLTKNGSESEDGVIYRSMAEYARDVVMTREGTVCSKIAAQFGDDQVLQSARARLELLKRTPANTLSSNVAGLQPAQHINQIFQVIDKSRPLVASASRTTLERGSLTYPKVTTRPVVSVQATEKTEAGNQGMVIDMVTATASTYLGGGDLSWQAINWSTPDALQLWFDLAAADYALKTEQDAAQALQHSGFSNNIASTIGDTATYADFMTAVGAGYAEVFANSGRIADTVYMAPDRYGYLLGLTSAAFSQFTSVNGDNVGPLNIVISRGMDSGVIVVGDKSGLLVAETAGAPVELRVVEPAIGGVEVGLIGAFEAVVVDNGAFAMLTTAS